MLDPTSMIFYLCNNDWSNKLLFKLTGGLGDVKKISGDHCIQRSTMNHALSVDNIIGNICLTLAKFGLVVKIVHGRRNNEED